MRRILVALVALAALGLGSPAAADQGRGDEAGRPLQAALSSDNEVPPSGTGASGTAEVSLNQGQGRICVEIHADGLSSAVVAGHIHTGVAGVNGGVVVNLGVNSADFQNCIDGVDPTLIRDIRQNPGAYYINVHTMMVPSGEIRGQLSK